MSVIRSFCSAFLMYSRIPMPQVKWKEENRRYALCFFPLIGAVIGGLILLWYLACARLGVGPFLFAAVSTVIPVAVTGGIHLDGFCDVNDAKACGGTRERMLAVMSDSHIGAFAAIHLAVYLLLQAGFFSQVESLTLAAVCALSFVQSRAYSGLAAVTFRSAKDQGALMNFRKPAHKRVTVAVELIFLIATAVVMIDLSPVSGGFGVLGGILSFVYYRVFAYRRFGGITGDLAGYFLQICELAVLVCAVLAELIVGVV